MIIISRTIGPVWFTVNENHQLMLYSIERPPRKDEYNGEDTVCLCPDIGTLDTVIQIFKKPPPPHSHGYENYS